MINTLSFYKKPFVLFTLALAFSVHAQNPSPNNANWQPFEALYMHPQLQGLPTGSQVNIQVQPHPKLNANCPLPLFKVGPEQKQWGKTIAQVQCPGQSSGLFFVTLMVDVMLPVLVTRRALAKGEELRPEDLQLVVHNIAQLKQGYFSNPKQLEQKKTTQALSAGAVIELRYVEGPSLIKQGDKVRVKLTGQNFGVEGQAVALDNGGFGDAVRVRTPQGRVLRGKAIEFMVVELLL